MSFRDYPDKGVVIVGTDKGKAAPVTVGANGTVLSADSSKASGVTWVVPPGGNGGDSYLMWAGL